MDERLFTQDDLSAYSNIARFAKLLQTITLSKLNRIANAFNMPLSEFLNRKKM